MRTIIVLLPQSTSLSPTMMFLRACSLSSGATASSQSRKMMSALDCAAFLNNAGLVPGTASSERCNLGVACSIVVKLKLNARSCRGAPRGHLSQYLGDRRSKFARAGCDRQAEGFHGLGFFRGAVPRGRDDGTRMAHASPFGCGESGHVSDDRLGHVFLHPSGRFRLLRTTDFSDHDDRF